MPTVGGFGYPSCSLLYGSLIMTLTGSEADGDMRKRGIGVVGGERDARRAVAARGWGSTYARGLKN